MSYIGHGLSHAVFGGAAISSVMGVSYFLGAGLWGVLAALLIGRVASGASIGADAAIGVVTTASFAIGLAIQSRSGVGVTIDWTRSCSATCSACSHATSWRSWSSESS